MPPGDGPLWPYFHKSKDKPNGSHHRATHWRCIDAKRPQNEPIDVDASADVTLIKNAEWFEEALADALEAKDDVNGEKKAMASHLRTCPHATAHEKAKAAEVAPTKAEQKAAQTTAAKRAREAVPSDIDDQAPAAASSTNKKRKLVQAVETSLKQSKLEVFKGLDIPFSVAQTEMIHAQFLRATQSANLPEIWTSDPEVMKLLMMFRSRAGDVIPSRTQLGGSLLRNASNVVDAVIRRDIAGADVLMYTDGWRVNKDSVGGVGVSHKFKNHVIDLIRINAWSKDGESMAQRFGEMIDKAEAEWGCNVVGFLTDNDGGSKKGRKVLALIRVWLLLFPCCAHQGQLILAEYLRDHPRAAEIMEALIDFINWLNSKDKVRDIFDQTQQMMNGKILAYLLPNLTRWTTHLVAALRFNDLKTVIRYVILNNRDEVIKAQIGAEANQRKRQEMRQVVIDHCDILEPNAWWDELAKIINDIEHICYLTNIAQSDHVRPDQFFLALTGLYLHFGRFSARAQADERVIGAKMCTRIEKRFKELDQAVFVLALVLNPFQKLERFGDKANIDPFILSMELVALYKRVKSRPPSAPRTAEEQQLHEEAQAQAVKSPM